MMDMFLMFTCLYVLMPICMSQILNSLHKSISFLGHQHFVSLGYGDSMPEMQESFFFSFLL